MSGFQVDFKELDRERPIGVSGLMRVKNDGQFVSASIESCIVALDELVIVYDDSEDNTETVVRQKQKEYPDKIRVYHYEPELLSHNLSDTEFERVLNLPPDSEHLLANYYNWTMSKVSYRYAFKIDADQIYFTEKLKKICDLYRSADTSKINLGEFVSYAFFRATCKFFEIFPSLLTPRSSHLLFGPRTADKVESYTFKRIQNDKVITSFSGINVFWDQELCVPMGTFSNGIQPPINGSGDHLFFCPSSQSKYVPWPQREYHRVIEIMSPSSRVFWGGGFLWVHFNAMRNQVYANNLLKYRGHLAPMNVFLTQNFLSLERKYNFRINSFMRPIILLALLSGRETLKKDVEKAYSSAI